MSRLIMLYAAISAASHMHLRTAPLPSFTSPLAVAPMSPLASLLAVLLDDSRDLIAARSVFHQPSHRGRSSDLLPQIVLGED